MSGRAQADSFFHLRWSTEIGCGWVGAVASSVGARVLFVKGPTLHRQGLREQRQSSDIDVLADPDGFESLCRAIEGAGWRERPSVTLATRVSRHSRTFSSPTWPCDIDVHRWFPGFLNDPRVVFDELWERKTYARFGSQLCPVPDRVSNTLILALHSMRGTQRQSRHLRELMFLERADFTAVELLQIRELASATGCSETLAPFLSALSIGTHEAPPQQDTATARALREWHERVDAGSHGAYMWILALRREKLRHRPALLWRALWPSDRDLLLSRPEVQDEFWAKTAARLARIGRGVRSLPQGVKAIWRHRSSGRSTSAATRAPTRRVGES